MPDLRAKIIEAIDNSIDNFIPASELEEAADAVIEVLREQEPVAWAPTKGNGEPVSTAVRSVIEGGEALWSRPLYAAPVPPAEPVVPEGWVLVPLNPTTEMLHAGQWREYVAEGGELIDAPLDTVADAYLNMLAAAPKQGGQT